MLGVQVDSYAAAVEGLRLVNMSHVRSLHCMFGSKQGLSTPVLGNSITVIAPTTGQQLTGIREMSKSDVQETQISEF